MEHFRRSEELEEIVTQLSGLSKDITIVSKFKIAVVFTDKKGGRYGARCVKLPAVVNFVTEYAFIILIRERVFDAIDAERKLLLLIHELLHIDGALKEDKDTKQEVWIPKTRPHNNRYCSFLEHETKDSEVTKIFDEVSGQILPMINKLKRKAKSLEEYISVET